MHSWIEITGKAALIGIGATAIMDLWLLLLKKWHVPTMNFALLGRWVGHVVRGRWSHDGMARSAPIRHELAIGWLAHYAIGLGFGILHVAVFGTAWLADPTLLPALTTGVATAVAPLFILQPAMGSGIASSKTPAPVLNSCKSLLNHCVFGGGIYLAGASVNWL